MSTDRIEKCVTLRAPRSRVWRALTDAREFGRWFRVSLQGDFEVGRTISGNITYPGYEHIVFQADVVAIEPEHTFVFRWHPYAVDPEKDYSHESKTRVEFTLRDIPEGTLLTVVESGFDKLPPDRREQAFRMNSGGWDEQARNIQEYVQTP